MLNEIVKYLDGTDALYDFADAVVVARLKMTLDMYLEESDRLDRRSILTEPQRQDYEELSGDIVAIQRVLGFYTLTTGDQE